MHLVCPVLLTEADFIITTKHQNYQCTPTTFTASPRYGTLDAPTRLQCHF